jgi:tryptophanyl-tRNA synthetase
MTAVTDPARQRRHDQWHPDVCNVYSLHKFFNGNLIAEIAEKCKSAKIGCVECKELLARGINGALRDFRERRIEFERYPDRIYSILETGAQRAHSIAEQTIDEVKHKMGLLKNA